MKQPVLDIVVVNHKTPEDLAPCLGSLIDHSPTGSHTVTIVHTSPDQVDLDVAEFYVRRDHSDARWSEHVWDDNVGYNVACNAAGADGWGQYVAFLNADTATSPGAFDELIAGMERHPEWGIVGPRQVNGVNKLTAAGTLGTNERHDLRGWQEDDHGQYSEVRDDAVCVSGSFLLMRRSVFDELTECPIYSELVNEPGPWGDFSHYFGDQWVGFHARAHGHLCVYVGPVQVRHEWHRASAVGGYGETKWEDDRARFVELCKAHGIEYNP